MGIIEAIKQITFEKGLEKGMEKGIEKGKTEVVANLISTGNFSISQLLISLTPLKVLYEK